MPIIIEMVEDDSSPDVTFNITRGGTPVNLTGCTVRFIIKNKTSGLHTNDAANTCTITSAAGGVCVYSWASTDLPDPVLYEGDLRITFPSGKQETKKLGITAAQRA